LVGRYDPDAVDMLRSYGAVEGKLKINCRNTRQITTYTELVTNGDLGTPSAGEGPEVKVIAYANAADQCNELDEEIRRLLRLDVAKGDITILSPLSLDQSCVCRTQVYAKGWIRELDEGAAAQWPASNITFARVADFKGFENRFCLLVDVEGVDGDLDVNTLYVALSRARAGLWMALPASAHKRINEIARANLPKLFGALRTTSPTEGSAP